MASTRSRCRFFVHVIVGTIFVVSFGGEHPVARDRIEIRPLTVDLPGAPARIVPADVDRDGRVDLVGYLAYSEVESVSEDRIVDLVQVSVVVPAVFERREVRVWFATEDGGYAERAAPLAAEDDLIAIASGPPGADAVVLTDRGLARLTSEPSASGRATLRLKPIAEVRPLFAGSGTFRARLELTRDVDGDGWLDAVVPTASGTRVLYGSPQGFDTEAATNVVWPAVPGRREAPWRRGVPEVSVEDIDGDGRRDLVSWDVRSGFDVPRVLLGSDDRRFVAPRNAPLDCLDDGAEIRVAGRRDDEAPWLEGVVEIRNLDGVGRAEVVTIRTSGRGDGMRASIRDAKRPRQTVAFHRLNDRLEIEPEPYFEMNVEGHFFEDSGGELGFERFADLDGDGLEDMIGVTFGGSLFTLVRAVATKSVKIGIDFQVYRQLGSGEFERVEGLDLSEKLKFDLDDVRLTRFAQFAGDFDGDGRVDFVHLGRGRDVTIHRGEPGCRYPKRPDLAIRLDDELEDLLQVRIEDLDGDGRSDLRIVRPKPATDPDESAPVRLDLYLTGGVS